MADAGGNYLVRWKDPYDRSWQYAEHFKAPNKGHRCLFPSRQKARQWIRNNWFAVVILPAEIVHPDGTRELVAS